MFIDSQAVFIYGGAGVGKTKMIEHIANFFQNKKKLFVTNTHSALANLKARIKSPTSSFSTIAKVIKSPPSCVEVLIVDECSTISNNDMCKLLNKISCEVLVCVGDTFQIEAIRFGNWFEYVRSFVKQNAVVDLTKPYRTSDEKLLTLWDKVRNLKDDIAETLSDFIKPLEEFEFRSDEGDEIILCLNYGGLYGINNINRIIQENNANQGFEFQGLIYKQGDPILFNETKRFGDEIHNNLKGKICKIEQLENGLKFIVELNKTLEKPIIPSFELIQTQDNKSVIGFEVLNHNADNDDEEEKNVVPFQLAYAISIHKAQGLEYDCVKIIISNEIEEQITHNIFYTAITRAKKDLKLFCSADTMSAILNAMKATHSARTKDRNKDLIILKNKQ